jgi:hypothetical protein
MGELVQDHRHDPSDENGQEEGIGKIGAQEHAERVREGKGKEKATGLAVLFRNGSFTLAEVPVRILNHAALLSACLVALFCRDASFHGSFHPLSPRQVEDQRIADPDESLADVEGLINIESPPAEILARIPFVPLPAHSSTKPSE